MSFTDAIAICFTEYATFTGRASRREFWVWAAFTAAAITGSLVLDAVLFGLDQGGTLSVAVACAAIFPSAAVTFRRLHDTNRSGWWFGSWLAAALTAVVTGPMPALDGQQTGAGPASPFMPAVTVTALLTMLLAWLLSARSAPGPNEYGDHAPQQRPAPVERQVRVVPAVALDALAILDEPAGPDRGGKGDLPAPSGRSDFPHSSCDSAPTSPSAE